MRYEKYLWMAKLQFGVKENIISKVADDKSELWKTVRLLTSFKQSQ